MAVFALTLRGGCTPGGVGRLLRRRRCSRVAGVGAGRQLPPTTTRGPLPCPSLLLCPSLPPGTFEKAQAPPVQHAPSALCCLPPPSFPPPGTPLEPAAKRRLVGPLSSAYLLSLPLNAGLLAWGGWVVLAGDGACWSAGQKSMPNSSERRQHPPPSLRHSRKGGVLCHGGQRPSPLLRRALCGWVGGWVWVGWVGGGGGGGGGCVCVCVGGGGGGGMARGVRAGRLTPTRASRYARHADALHAPGRTAPAAPCRPLPSSLLFTCSHVWRLWCDPGPSVSCTLCRHGRACKAHLRRSSACIICGRAYKTRLHLWEGTARTPGGPRFRRARPPRRRRPFPHAPPPPLFFALRPPCFSVGILVSYNQLGDVEHGNTWHSVTRTGASSMLHLIGSFGAAHRCAGPGRRGRGSRGAIDGGCVGALQSSECGCP